MSAYDYYQSDFEFISSGEEVVTETSEGNETPSEASVLFVDEITYFSDYSETPLNTEGFSSDSSSALNFFTEVFARDSASNGNTCSIGSATGSADGSSLECFDLEIVINRTVESDNEHGEESTTGNAVTDNCFSDLQEQEAQNVFDQNTFANDFHMSVMEDSSVRSAQRESDLASINDTEKKTLDDKHFTSRNKLKKESLPDVENVLSVMSGFSDESVGKLGAVFAISNIVLQKTMSAVFKSWNCGANTRAGFPRNEETLKGVLLTAFSVFSMFSYFANVDLKDNSNSYLAWPVFNIALSVVFGAGNYLVEAFLYYFWVSM
ncbi:hypothetical protein ACO0QE_001123 [Hanseniaspora vineae]